MGVRHVLCHLIILTCLVTFLFSIMYYVVSDKTYPSKYCSRELCPLHVHHIGCHPPGFSLICIKPRLTKLSTGMKRMIMNEHNQRRNQLASGLVPGLKPAVRMATVTWNNDLAYLASINTKECELRYDTCRNTKEYGFVGQNIANMKVNYKSINSDIIHEIVPKIMDLWFSEYSEATQALMDNYQPKEGANVQNFSNIIHERTVKVGCGMTTYFSLSKKLMILFVCNYSFSPYPELPIYTSGPSCSQCKTGCNPPDYPSLCETGEHIYSDIY